jgi:hypothetical protein
MRDERREKRTESREQRAESREQITYRFSSALAASSPPSCPCVTV